MLSKNHQAHLLNVGSLEVYKTRNLFDKDKLEMFVSRIDTADNFFLFNAIALTGTSITVPLFEISLFSLVLIGRGQGSPLSVQ